MKYARWSLPAVLILLLIAGSVLLVRNLQSRNGFIDADQPVHQVEEVVGLERDAPVGQTFVARHAGLAGIEFYLHPDAKQSSTLWLHLRSSPQAGSDITGTTLQLEAGTPPGFHRFDFPALEDSHGRYYYAYVVAEPEGDHGTGLSVPMAHGSAYLDGSAYVDHEPLDAQTSFRLVYSPGPVLLDLVKAIPGWLGLLVGAFLLFVVPGWALLAWLWPGRPLAWPEMAGLALGGSLALYPLLFLWTDLVGLHLGPGYAWIPVIAGLMALVWRYRSWRPRAALDTLRKWARSAAVWPDLTLLVVLALVFGVRLVAVRTLETPLWADSYHHTMIAQLLVENGGLFDSWAPYAQLDRFSYHFGFHSTVAAFEWLTGLPSVEATIWMPQVLNGMAVLALYPLALRVTRSRWGAVWAVLLAGLLAPMPMSYVNWGRFTQIAAQVILPAVVWLTWQMVEMPDRKWPSMALVALTAAGLALTHYRVLIFYIVFVVALMLFSLRRGLWREALLRLGVCSAGSLFLCLPWFAPLLGSSSARIAAEQVTTAPANAHAFTWEYNELGTLDFYLSPTLWLSALLGLTVGLLRRQRGVLLVGAWWFLLLIATNPAWLSLPGTGVITNFALFIAAYIPVSLLSGELVANIARPLGDRKWVGALLFGLFVAVGLWGATERIGDPNQAGNSLVARPDVRAAAWIRENTPDDARFLINSCAAYGGGVLVGSDGGWWLPLLAERQNTVPPQVYGSELSPDSELPQQVQRLARQVRDHGADDPTTLALLGDQGVTHVYIGQKQGAVQCTPEEAIVPESLENSAALEIVYHEDRVWIFKIVE